VDIGQNTFLTSSLFAYKNGKNNLK